MNYKELFNDILKSYREDDTESFIKKVVKIKNNFLLYDLIVDVEFDDHTYTEMILTDDGYRFPVYYSRKDKNNVVDELLDNILIEYEYDHYEYDVSSADDRIEFLKFISNLINSFSNFKEEQIKAFTLYAYSMLKHDEFVDFYLNNKTCFNIGSLIARHISECGNRHADGCSENYSLDPEKYLIKKDSSFARYAKMILNIIDNHEYGDTLSIDGRIKVLFKEMFPDVSSFQQTYSDVKNELIFFKKIYIEVFSSQKKEIQEANYHHYESDIREIDDNLLNYQLDADMLAQKYECTENNTNQIFTFLSCLKSSHSLIHHLFWFEGDFKKMSDINQLRYLNLESIIDNIGITTLLSLFDDLSYVRTIDSEVADYRTSTFMCLLIKASEINIESFYLKHTYVAPSLNSTRKEEIVKKFFSSAFDEYLDENLHVSSCLFEYNNKGISPQAIMDPNQKSIVIDMAFDSIKNNTKIIDQIVSGELQAAPMCENQDDDILQGWDFTNYLVCQIKSVERYLKEVLIQYHLNDIHRTSTERFLKPEFRYLRNRYPYIKKIQAVPQNIQDYFYINEGPKYSLISSMGRINLSNVANPTAEDLSSPESKSRNLECGSAYIAIKYAYRSERQLPQLFTMDYFYQFGLQDVRNENLHTLMIESVRELKEKRTKLAFWFIYCILNLGNKGVLTR